MIGHLQTRKAPQVHARGGSPALGGFGATGGAAGHQPSAERRNPPWIGFRSWSRSTSLGGGEPRAGWMPGPLPRRDIEADRWSWRRLEVRGLMTMAPWTEDEGVPSETGVSAACGCSRSRVRSSGPASGARSLSMGMSNDYPTCRRGGKHDGANWYCTPGRKRPR